MTLEQGLITHTYTRVEKLIHKTVWKFSKFYHIPYDDLMSECGEKFMEIYRTHRPESSKFTTWLVNKLRYHLLQVIRDRNIHRYHFPMEEGSEEYSPVDNCSVLYSDFHLFELEEILSEKAREVMDVCLNTPFDVFLAVTAAGDATPTRLKQAIREYLVCQGWESSEVTSCFEEIEEALLS
jgi:hypothetical protein